MKVKVIEHARYGKCRVGEEGWIVGRDVARILGYANADGFVRKHVAAQNKRLDSVRALDSLHCARTALINQAGLDELLAATDNPDAAEIKAWLLSESARLDAVHSEESNSLPQVLVPQVFNHPQFGNLRAVNIGGEPFFIGIDVARALGYRNTRQAIIDHVPDKFKKDGVAIRDSVGGTNSPILINEAGLYKLIMRSRLPETEKFSDWACGEVLPSIRKDGCYVASEQNNNLLRRKEYERRCYEEAKLAYDAFIPYYPLTLENLDGEIWKEIDEHYHVSNFGRVKSFKKGKQIILKPQLRGLYLSVTLCIGGKKKSNYLHILAAQSFIPNPDNKPEVNHEDGHKFNCHVSNLYWSTSTENKRHAVRTGLQKSGVDSYQAKIQSDADIIYIRDNPDNLTQKQLAEKFGVKQVTISAIQIGKTHKKAGGTLSEPKNPHVSEESKRQILIEYKKGVRGCGLEALGKKFGHSSATVWRIVNCSCG